MANSGWVLLHRKLQAHWVYPTGKFTDCEALIDLIFQAAHTERKTKIDGQLVNIQIGEIYTSHLKLSKRWGWTRRRVSSFLETLENDTTISTTKHTPNSTTIKLNQYEALQLKNKDDNTTDSTTNDTPNSAPNSTPNSTTYKEINKGKEGLKKISSSGPKRYAFLEGDMELAQEIYQGVLRVYAGTKEPNFEQWADTIRLIREREKRTLEEISSLFQWANQDKFWRTNILSPAKLREKWDRLAAQKNTGQNPTNRVYRDDFNDDGAI